MNDQTNENEADVKVVKKDEFNLLSVIADFFSNRAKKAEEGGVLAFIEERIFSFIEKVGIDVFLSLSFGVAMIMSYDIGGLAESPNPLHYISGGKWGLISLIFWFWSRPLGVLLLAFGLYTIWDNNFSKSKTDKME
jgi:hypothetical protein